MPDLMPGYNLIRMYALMVRRRVCAVSNHEFRGPSFETREDALLRMGSVLVERVLNDV
jgi:hypothetical protein